MKLLHEMVSTDVGGVILEFVGGVKQYLFEAPCIQANVKNRNGRLYRREMMEQVVEDYINEHINTGRAVGELGHPASPTINYERASHKILSLTPDGNNWIGKAKVLAEENFPMAKVVRGLIDEGIKFGVSTRGVGALAKPSGGVTEVHNFKLSTAFDVVSDPSGPDAWAQSLMENADWVFDAASGNWRAQRVMEETIAEFKPQRHSQITEQAKFAAFERYLNSLVGK